jgi:ketosteroid isomerase-like protein
VTPDRGELQGGTAIADIFASSPSHSPTSDTKSRTHTKWATWRSTEGFITGTHTQPLPVPNGEDIPPTGKRIRVRECDVVTVEGGVVTSHHFYFDQVEFLGQLGLLPEMPF